MKERIIDSLFTKQSIRRCVKELEKNTEIYMCETSCGRMLIGEDKGEEVEVRIIVNRDKASFLGDFEMVSYQRGDENQH